MMEKPDWADDPVKVKHRQEQRRQTIKLGKRKSRDVEGEASGRETRPRTGERERSINLWGEGETLGLGRGSRIDSAGNSVPRRIVGKGKAIRGGFGRRF